MPNNISLKYLFNQQNLNARHGRWLAFFSEFNFEIKHIKGKENKVVDALSRKINQINTMIANSYQTNLKFEVKSATKNDEKYKVYKNKMSKQ